HQTPESPFLPQDLLQRERICRRRHSVEGVEGAHQGSSTGFDSRVKWWQIELRQSMLRDFGGVVVSPTLRRAIANIVLGARGNAIRRIQTRTLVAPYVGGRHRGTQKRILARTFCHASPTSVARDVDHRGKRPPDAARR